MLIENNNTRRFTVEGRVEIFAIFDSCRSWTKYGVVCLDEAGRWVFDMATVRTFFADEIAEI